SNHGLGAWEGPYPTLGVPFRVRWGYGPETRLRFRTSDDAPRTLRFVASSYRQQTMTVVLDGTVVTRVTFDEDDVMRERSIPLTQRAGEHELALRYAHWSDRGHAVLFRAIEIEPATTLLDGAPGR